ncbi:MAG: outer membrane lipoprotein-sorting protein [Nitrospinaceae bacterium]|nr:outer membrane lipoprotein-sorting protein [Nitrospinaceae bacterium]NIR54852.1 outer membrane lipoprotein-sorting protein [Nitrospinaceae bacterium]NIS85277.1 outer membrane lipoprotein-sorting protein [Nitrospinaceae bacterium]NIT82090.1 outer membrane lipoprotein-sorting protein [Nitrospinaceae bacterium]NIU44351.1 outer membrane lipoprotein-sorting protein [Nitrospinaceae bacterium]
MKIIIRYLWSVLLTGSLLSPAAAAVSPEEKGLAIAREDDRRDNGFQDYRAKSIMILKNRQGEKSVRHLRFKVLEVNGDGDKNLTVFDRPRDIKKTAFLNYTHPLGDDDQWLYLPALKRVKRITSSNKSGPFVGSEFAYEDMTSQEVEKYTYKWLRDEDYQGQKCFVVERYPAYENSGYVRQVVWIDQKEYRMLKVEFYDRKNALLKTLVLEGYHKYLDQYWYPDRMFMENHQTGKTTLLKWSDYKFKNGYSDKDFNRNSLKRAR